MRATNPASDAEMGSKIFSVVPGKIGTVLVRFVGIYNRTLFLFTYATIQIQLAALTCPVSEFVVYV